MLNRVNEILSRVDSDAPPIRRTEVYNEGWMLRLLLDWASSLAPPDHPLAFHPGATWYSEALLPSAFLARSRGDPLAEGWTNADGCVGHFDINLSGRADLVLRPTASQLVVVEAKMMSGLSQGTKRAPTFDQAARNVACMAEVIARATCPLNMIERLAFYVIAPQQQISTGIFGDLVTRESVDAKVQQRVAAYAGERNSWYERYFVPMLDAVEVGLLSWEGLLPRGESEFDIFYRRCLEYNDKGGGAAA